MRLRLPLMLCLALFATPAAAEPAHYRVAATFLPETAMVAVDLAIELPPAAAGERASFVLGRDFTILRASAAGAEPAVLRRTDRPWPGLQEVSLRFSRAVERPVVRLLYHGRLNPTGDLPINLIAPRLVEVSLDGMWLPIRPDLRGAFTVEARLSGLPADAVVAAQGRVERSGGRILVRRTIPDIDFAFAASPSLRAVEQDGYTLYAADPAGPLARLYAEHISGARPFLTAWLGEIGGDPLRLAIVERPRRSGYARRGYIVVVDQGTMPPVANAAKFIAHELGHLWFANADPTSADRWLDESTAEYVGLRYVEAVFGVEAREGLVEAKRTEAAAAPPLLDGPTGAGLYAKGPLLLFELEARIGRARIDALLAEVARARIGRTADFLAALERQASAADARWFETRLRQ